MPIEEVSTPNLPGPAPLYELRVRAFDAGPGRPPRVVVEAPTDDTATCLMLLASAAQSLAVGLVQQKKRGVEPATESIMSRIIGHNGRG